MFHCIPVKAWSVWWDNVKKSSTLTMHRNMNVLCTYLKQVRKFITRFSVYRSCTAVKSWACSWCKTKSRKTLVKLRNHSSSRSVLSFQGSLRMRMRWAISMYFVNPAIYLPIKPSKVSRVQVELH